MECFFLADSSDNKELTTRFTESNLAGNVIDPTLPCGYMRNDGIWVPCPEIHGDIPSAGDLFEKPEIPDVQFQCAETQIVHGYESDWYDDYVSESQGCLTCRFVCPDGSRITLSPGILFSSNYGKYFFTDGRKDFENYLINTLDNFHSYDITKKHLFHISFF